MRATLAIRPTNRISRMSPVKSPMTEERVATFIALEERPRFDSGKPSIWVAAAAAVPGVLKRMAAMEPP